MIKEIKSIALTILVLMASRSGAIASGDLLDPSTLPSDETGVEDINLSNPFTIELKVGTQSPWNKKVPIEVIFTPTLDSSRTQVAWDVPLGLTVEKKYNDFFAAKAGQTYTVEALLSPEQSGTYNVVVNITNWGYGSNVTSSQRVSLTFDDSKIVTPRTAGFQSASMVRYIVILTILILVVVTTVIGTRKGMKSLKKWLKPPQ